jgi:hypothetical protein
MLQFIVKNEQQFRITKEKLAGMTARVERLRARYPNDADFRFYSETTRAQIQ